MSRFAALLLLAGCGAPAPLVARAAPEHPVLKEEVRALARSPCGSCHQSSLDSAKPAALAIFDLDKTDWSRSIKTTQLQEFLSRLNSSLDDTTRPRVRAFLEAELAARQ